MVATRCFTFNHAPYIEDAMNGFATQETTFPVVTLIIDDASTDGEPEVIRKYIAEHFQSPYRVEETEYANIICAKHKTNENCDFVVFLLKYNHHSIKKPKMPYLSKWLDNAKYHAICEGDDYWTDSHKLQRQVDFLKSHPDYSMCFHNAIVDRKEQNLENTVFADLQTREYTPNELTIRWLTPTASLLYVADCDDLYRQTSGVNNVVYADSFLRNCCIHLGKIYCLSDVMSVYRKQPGGMVFNRSIEQKKRFCKQLSYTAKVFPEQKKSISDVLSLSYFELSVSCASRKRIMDAIKFFIHSLLSSPKMFVNSINEYLRPKS